MKTAEPKAKDANVEKCVALMRSRADLGLKKYGKTTERTDLTPLEWVRHWQAENSDATIYAEKLAQEIGNLTATNARLESMLAERNDELEVLRKAVADGGRFLLTTANLYAAGRIPECRSHLSMAAIALGVDLQWPGIFQLLDSAKEAIDKFKAAKRQTSDAAKREPAKAHKLTPCEQVRLERHERWNDAKKTPPEVGHAVLGMVNGTTKTRAVYYDAKAGKWVDVNDRPVTVSQWRNLRRKNRAVS